MRTLFFLIGLSLVLGACKKDKEEGYSPVPQIEFLSISPQTVHAFSDPIVITIRYRDGDGDLGENSPDAKNAFVKDLRNSLTYSFRIRQLAPDENIKITGTLEIVVPGSTLLSGNSTESVKFSVYVKDRAGNTSNSIETGSINIIP